MVKVPVLSEQMTDTAPSVSTVLRDLHKTLFLRIKLAVIVRLAVKAMGRPSGMNAIATLTQSTIKVGTLIHEGWSLRSQPALKQKWASRILRVRCHNTPQNDYKHDSGEHDRDDYDDKAQDLLFKCGHASLRLVRQLRNASKDCLIASSHNNTQSTARDAVSALHSDALGLKIIVVGRIYCTRKR